MSAQQFTFQQSTVPPGGQPGIQPGSQPGWQTGAQSGPDHGGTKPTTPTPISPYLGMRLVPVPDAPIWRSTLDAKETVNAATFVHEHKEWLDKLLLPSPPLAELLPKIFEHLTKDTIRVLPARYNDKLFEIFRRMGDHERRDWCIQNSTKQTVVPRKIIVPRSISQAAFARCTHRLWEIGHILNCREIPEGREVERLAWELMGLHESIAFNWITLFRERAILINDKTPIVFPTPPPPPSAHTTLNQKPIGDQPRDSAAGPHSGSPVQRTGNAGQLPANTGQLPLPGNAGQFQLPAIAGQFPLPGIAGQHPFQGNARQYPLQGNAGQLPLQGNNGQLPLQGNNGQLPLPGVAGQLPLSGLAGYPPLPGLGGQLPLPGLAGQLPLPGNPGQLPRNPFQPN